MAGRKNRSGGHNKLSASLHVLRGTYNATRHGPRPSPLATAPVLRVDPIPAAVVAGLADRGRAFALDCWQTYAGWTPPGLALLRQAAQCLDALDVQPGDHAARRGLLATLAALRLDG